MPQKDNLCGAFWGSLALRAAGIEQVDGEPVDQDTVAREAGAILPSGGDPASWLPPGGTSRDDYRLELPTRDDESITGTSAIGVAAAVEKLAGGALTALPVTGGFTAENVLGLIGGSGRGGAGCRPGRQHPDRAAVELAPADGGRAERHWPGGRWRRRRPTGLSATSSASPACCTGTAARW